jgi:hypothetical protein
MKVHIGPYRNWARCQLHYNYMNKKYDHKWDDNHNRFERVLEKIEDAIQWFYNVTINKLWNNRKRKIKIHIDDYDTWGMDNTLAMIIVPMLKQLKATKHGCPLVDLSDVPEELRKEDKDERIDYMLKRWEWVLDEMIWTFEACADEDFDTQFYSGDVDWLFQKDEDTGLSHMVRGPKHTFTVDREAMQAAQKRIENGLRLFGRYYQALWD